MKKILRQFVFLVATALTFSSCSTTIEKKPNIILIIVDDQGYGDVGAHGKEIIKTPNIDALHDVSARVEIGAYYVEIEKL